MSVGPAPNISLAVVDGDLVLFDIGQDTYLAVDRDAARNSVNALLGHSYTPSDPVLTELIAQGLLLRGAPPWMPDAKPRPQPLPAVQCKHSQDRLTIPFLRASLGTYLALQKRDNRWAAVLPVQDIGNDPSPEQMASIIGQFENWRILIPGTGRCLVQSMMLMRLLAIIKIKAEWVFGVRTHPFEAHCWVEWQSMVLNDSPDHVSWFTVIARL
ncbi:lasso peptide biosynthesis B2 protein [Blastomonas sp.]|uniref:lasso peptide biosynthesis B2 protein n=1 Tax=Blastomonas sp. TaxID=1909299 RepID=UPI0026157CEC|nr:lasso peptide biosynthesis B2 protein [Blastomonas sp.]MDM7955799.1 lasso peptide biosynthesis B2 protein [Blastomonas sp.]